MLGLILGQVAQGFLDQEASNMDTCNLDLLWGKYMNFHGISSPMWGKVILPSLFRNPRDEHCYAPSLSLFLFIEERNTLDAITVLLQEIKEKNPYPQNDILDLSRNISDLCKKKYKTSKGKYIEIKGLPFMFLKTDEVEVMSRGWNTCQETELH